MNSSSRWNFSHKVRSRRINRNEHGIFSVFRNLTEFLLVADFDDVDDQLLLKDVITLLNDV